MRMVTLLLHDERFSGWSIQDKLTRFHFSLQYLRFCKDFGWDPYLYCFHQSIRKMRIHVLRGLGVVKVFPVKFRFPPFLRFGNDHNPRAIREEMLYDNPDLVHFHHYYLFSFPYTAHIVKQKLKCPLVAQLHGYHNNYVKQSMFWPCLLALRMADRILYSYKPEELLYKGLGLLSKATRIPMPGIDPSLFKPGKRRNSNKLLYVGRVPLSTGINEEKSPHSLLFVLHKLLQHRKDVTLTIIGDGPGLSYCKWLASKLGITKYVTFKGYVPRSRLPQYYRSSLLTIVPLEVYDIDGWFDGVIQESLACGTPVAAFAPSWKTRLKGTFGFLLSKTPDRAADELSLLLNVPEVMEELAQRGSRFVRKYCTEEKLAEKLRATWEEAIGR
ncbi:MAG: glycosyltransferase [Candidatus Freyarchaeota archaeon]